ncbi:MAG: PmoA family protein [Chloroflexi bacterium]|nr:PmoA family protein [Chloroflexota bacterium]
MEYRKKIAVADADGIRGAAPVSILLPDAGSARSVRMVESSGGRDVPCQLEAIGQGALLTWVAEGIEADATGRYEAVLSDAPASSPEETVRLRTTDERLDVHFDGDLFTSYYFGAQRHRPYFHPLIGPYGDPVTRGFPMIDDVPGESRDHVWHRGLYSAYGDVNGVDNWTEGEGRGHTVHRRFETLMSGPVYARAVALADWTTPDRRRALLGERREMTFYRLPVGRLIDIDLSLTARDEDVLFGDTKEGGLISLRVAGSMEVARGGRMENSLGGVDEGDLWGKRAAWCDYSGPVNGRTVGVAIFDHPLSFRHPTYWHARDYGLITTNPIAVSTFEGGGPSGEHLLPAGESLQVRYRVYVHAGDASEGRVAEQGRLYARPPRVVVE